MASPFEAASLDGLAPGFAPGHAVQVFICDVFFVVISVFVGFGDFSELVSLEGVDLVLSVSV